VLDQVKDLLFRLVRNGGLMTTDDYNEAAKLSILLENYQCGDNECFLKLASNATKIALGQS